MRLKLRTNTYYLILFIALFLTQNSIAQLAPTLVGNTIDQGNNCYRITANTNNQLGAVWYSNGIDLNNDFDIIFDANFGTNNSNGADGIVFVLKTSSAAVVGTAGGDLGYGGINNSMAVEFDTWQNNDRNDPSNDHVAILLNGITNHASGPSWIPNPVNASATSGNIEDGNLHDVKISWRAAAQEFKVVFDCNERILVSNQDLINTVFGGNSNVFFGFTGSTGGATNLQTVCFKSLSFVDEILLDDQNICSGDSINSIDATYDGATSYQWIPTTNVSNPNLPNPVFSPTIDTNYSVEITDACGEIISNDFDVTILPQDDSTFSALENCDGATMNVTGTLGGTFTFNTVPTDTAIINLTTGTITSGTSGATYSVQYTTNGTCPSNSTQSVTLNTTDDSAFIMLPSCDGATVDSVVTLGGIYVLNPVPTDGAIIDAATGTITGGQSETSYTVDYTTSGACSSTSSFTVTVDTTNDASFTMLSTCDGGTVASEASSGGTYSFNPIPTDGASIDSTTGTVIGGISATNYTIEYSLSGVCPSSSTFILTLETADDPTFTYTPTCDGATINTVTTSGGTYTFNPAPTDTAAINSITGTITNGTSGSTYSVQYTTNGTCPSSSTESVTVTTTDDSTFTMLSSCDGATVDSVVTSGGIYVLNPLPSDGATIDSATGTITGGISQTSYTVDYTSSGTCPSTSSFTATVNTTNDASFTMISNCDGGTVASEASPGGTYSLNPIPIDGATIDSTTGTVIGGTSAVNYTIEYSLAGACPSSSMFILTLETTDDSSFTYTSNCDGATINTVATLGGTYTFNPVPADTATLNSTTGTITNGTSGTSYMVEYTTNGTCPDSSIVSVTVITTDNSVFTMIPSCDGATIDTVLTPGGTYVFNPIPTDTATIDATTGTIINSVSGTSYTVDYTTNGTCPSTSSFTVTVDTTNDASFTMIVTCDGGTVSTEATSGGTYTFNPAPTDTAIIDTTTGTVTGGTSGDAYTIEYSLGGTCPSSSSVVLTVLTADDSSFTYTPTCDGATIDTVTTSGGTYTFNPTPTDSATINSTTGTITNGTSGDSYTVDYITNGTCPTTSTVIITANSLPVLVPPTPLEVCDDGTPDGMTLIDLTLKNIEISGGNPAYSVTYYIDQANADAETNALPNLYTNTTADLQTIFVRVEDVTTGCFDTTTLDLLVEQAPIAFTPTPLVDCDPDSDGFGVFTLSDTTLEITGGAAGLTVTYHETMADAGNNVNALTSPYNNIVVDTQTIYVRVESATIATDCATFVALVLTVNPTPQITTAANLTPLEVCDNDADGFAVFNLSTKEPEILNLLDTDTSNDLDPLLYTITYYENMANAEAPNNPITTPNAYVNTTMDLQTIWVRVEDNSTG
ncbi:L-type lectin-domain containing protein, partial [Lacinutrix jangbogonensis]